MSNFDQSTKRVSDLVNLEELTKAYGQIASVRMHNARAAVLHSRLYTEEINKIFQEVEQGYSQEIKELARQSKLPGSKSKKGITFLAHNGKNVAVFVAANTRLYGGLVQELFDQFAQEVGSGSEATIIGKYGRQLFLSRFPGRPYTYFDMPDHKTTSAQLEAVVKHIVQYDQIHVYYGKFQSLLTQLPTKYEISSRLDVQPGEGKNKYVFEPDLAKIMVFFESQIFASTFEQLVKESQLAKFGARIMAMDSASVKIRKQITKAKLAQLKLKHFDTNKRQLGSLVARELASN